MKRGCDKVRREMDAALNMTHGLEAKGFPKEMKAHYSEAIVPCMTMANAVLDEWGSWAKSDVLVGPLDKLEAAIKTIEARTKELDEKHASVEGQDEAVEVDLEVKDVSVVLKLPASVSRGVPLQEGWGHSNR